MLDGVKHKLNSSVKYEERVTPVLESISPRHGTVKGGTSVTFTGTDFSDKVSDYEILLDGVVCAVTSCSLTSVTCTTGKRVGLVETSIKIIIKGKGKVATKDHVFTYVQLWSDETTWGGEFPPVDGEMVYIPPGFNLVFDLDKSPVLSAVLVEGSLIFLPDPNPEHERHFDSHYIFVRNGTMEVGTEEHPYTSKCTITLHGDSKDPQLPIYGNKVLGVRYGTLDIHGQIRDPYWTVMETTAKKDDLKITLTRSVDWKVGEQIAIAPSSFNPHEAEKRWIVAIDRTNIEKPILTLDVPLDFDHYAATETYDGNTIEMRTEVGLLTRNIKIRGDETSRDNLYGPTVFIHSSGDDSLIARISHVEFFEVGQAY